MAIANSPCARMGYFLCFLACLVSTCFAEEEKKIVGEIEIKGLLTLPDNEIKAELTTQAGQPLSNESLVEDIKKLHSLGYFSKFQVQYQLLPGNKVKIIFVVVENPQLGEIYIKGNFSLDKSEILGKMRLYKRTHLDDSTLSLDIRDIKKMYQKKGFLFADIKTEIKRDSIGLPGDSDPGQGWLDLYIDIDEGPEVAIYEILFYGNRSFPKGDLLAFTETQESGLFSDHYYDEETLQKDIILIRNFYRSEGFLDIQVDLRDVFFSADRTEVTLNISVDEGPRYHVRNITLSGNTLFTDRELANRRQLKPGEIFKQMAMQEDAARIERLYGENGFVDIRVGPAYTIVDLENPLLDIAYRVQEGNISYIRKIDIDGNDLTRDDVVRRKLLSTPRELFKLGKIEESKQRLLALGYFAATPDGRPPVAIDIKDTDEKRWKDLSITVHEGPTGSLRFAAGITSDLGAVGEISLSKRNFDITDVPISFADFFSGESFTGAGQNLDLFFQAGKELVRFKISFDEPYLFGYNIGLGTGLYSTERVRESWDEGRTGGSISLGRYLDPYTRMTVQYRLEKIKVSDVDNDAPGDVFAVKGKSHLSSLSVDLTIDTSDDFILPTRGYILGASYEIVGVFLGGDYDYSMANFRAAWFQTLYTTAEKDKHVLSIGGRVGIADEHASSRSVPIFERFYAGGSSSIRGFEFRTVGPRENDDPIGGDFMILGTVEYGFPIYKDILRGAVFVDVGNVIPEVDSTIFDDLRVSVGFGFRLKVPMLGPRPFALDFGFPVREEDDDEKQIFSFSFGKPF